MKEETRMVGGVAFAVAGALLLGAVALIVALVLDLPVGLMWVLLLVALAAGGWYGWQLPRGLRARRSRDR